MTITYRSLALATALASGFASVAAAEDVTIRYLASQGGLSAHELARELGYFDGTGIELDNLGYASGGPETLMGLAGGSLDLASAATSAVLNSIAGGNDFVIAYATNGINEDVQSIFYVLEDSPIQSIEDIAGKTIAVNTLGAHLDYTVREALHQKGLAKDAANLVVVPGPQLEQVLRAEQVDIAGFGYWQTTFEGAARETGGIRPIFGDTDVLGAHPEQAQIFVEQSARALDWARENPEETRAIFARALEARGENPEVAQYFRGFGVREGGLPVIRDIQFWIDVFEREGQIPEGKLVAENLLLVTGDDVPATN